MQAITLTAKAIRMVCQRYSGAFSAIGITRLA
jgi:hypothetical protein